MSLEKNKVILAVVGIIAILLIGVFIVTNEQSSDNVSDIVVEPEPVVQEPEPEPVVQEPEPEPVVQEPEPEPVIPEPVREPEIIIPADVVEAIAAGEAVGEAPAPDPAPAAPPADPTEITIDSVTVEGNSVTVTVSITGDFDHWHLQLNFPLTPGDAGGIMVNNGFKYTFDDIKAGEHTVYAGAVDSMHYLIGEQASELFVIAELVVEPEPEPECAFGQEMAAGGECELVVLTEDVFMEIDGNFEFTMLKIKKGVTVTWKTTEKDLGAGGDVDYHQVYEVNGLFDSGGLSVGTKWSYTFNEVGEFHYICPPHPWMKATIIVVD